MTPQDEFDIFPGSEQALLYGQEGAWDELKSFVTNKENLKDVRDEALARSNLSITNFAKKLMIMSRVFIQNSVVDDPSLNDNLNTIQNQYLAFILSALSLNEDVGNNRTIRKQVELVATENYHSLNDIFKASGYSVGRESNNKSLKDDERQDRLKRRYQDYDDNEEYNEMLREREEAKKEREYQEDRNWKNRKREDKYQDEKDHRNRHYDDERSERNRKRQDDYIDDRTFEEQTRKDRQNRKYEEDLNNERAKRRVDEKVYDYDRAWKEKKRYDDYADDQKFEDRKRRDAFKRPADNARVDNNTRNLSLASGRIVQVTIGGKNVTIPVQLLPTVIPDDVAEKFISLNFQLSWRQRLVQAKAGEISWIKDFLFNVDQIRKVQEALKKDRSGVLYEMKEKQKNAAFEAVVKAASSNNKQNIANSIFIFEKSSFLRNAKAFGLNWKNQSSRDRFFNYTFSFMCVLIDPVYAKSEYYWSGIDAVGEYSAKQLKAASNNDSYNLKDIMTAFTQGHSPKFI